MPGTAPDTPTDPVVRNELSGTVAGSVVQAGTIHGDVHVHAPEPPLSIPRQLPGAVQDFVDREAELSTLTRFLVDSPKADGVVRIGVIDGTAGAGKTALAVHWAYKVRDKFPDGQLYVNLLGFDPSGNPLTSAEALQVLLECIGIPPNRVPATQAGRAAMYRSLLADRRVLVILDNAVESTQVEPLLPGGGQCVTLVTSRNRLDGLIIRHGAYRVGVGVLTKAASHDLLTKHLNDDQSAVRPHAVDEIAARCGYLPLALSIVAARVRYSPHLNPSELAGQISGTSSQLDAFDTGDVMANIRDVFSWSYGQLGTAPARVFRLLALHPGPDIGISTAESLVAMSNHQAMAHLRALVRANLLEEYMPNRFRFHDLLRIYAAEKAEVDEPDDARTIAVQRFLDGLLHSASNASIRLNPHRPEVKLNPCAPEAAVCSFDSHEEAMEWFKQEYQNIKATIEWTATHGFDEYTWRLTLAFWQYLYMCGRWHELIALHETALAAADRLGNAAAAAAVHNNLGIALGLLTKYEQGADHFRRALDLFRVEDNLGGQGNALDSLAWVYTCMEDFKSALSYCDQALAIYRQTDDPEGQARALDSIGVACAGLGRYAEGIDYGMQALELHQHTGSRIGQAHVRRSLGRCYALMGRHREAISQFEQALAVCREIGDRHDEANVLRDLGSAFHTVGADTEARACWEQAAVILTELRHPDADAVQADLESLPPSPGLAK